MRVTPLTGPAARITSTASQHPLVARRYFADDRLMIADNCNRYKKPHRNIPARLFVSMSENASHRDPEPRSTSDAFAGESHSDELQSRQAGRIVI
jgi:hypothetical protein